MTVEELLRRLQNVRQTGAGDWMAACPAHGDTNASLHITDTGEALLLHCFAGCRETDILDALGLAWKDMPYHREAAQPGTPRHYGLTLKEYADAKRLPLEALHSFMLAEGDRLAKSGKRNKGVMMPYLNPDGTLAKMRWRMRLTKEQGDEPCRFVWEKDGAVCLYGLWRQPPQRESVIVVEGESDCHALWLNGYPALGLPGASNYKPDRDDPILDAYRAVFVHLEKDSGGHAVFVRFAGDKAHRKPPSAVLKKCHFFCLPGYKDPSDAWQRLADRPQEFRALMANALANARPADQFQPPAGWPKEEEPPQPDQGKGSPRQPMLNLQTKGDRKGGRPIADYAALTESYALRLRDTKGRLLLRHWRGAWYQYNGRCWKPVPDADVEARAMAFLQEDETAPTYHIQITRSALANLMANLMSSRYCGVSAETTAPAWLTDGQPAEGWMAMGNELVNIEEIVRRWKTAPDADTDGKTDILLPPEEPEIAECVRPLTPDLLSTFALDYSFDHSAQCPRFREWLAQTIPDPEVRDAMQAMMGLALVPDTSYNVCFFLAGEGGTGKSTFLHILQELVGQANVCRVPLLKMDDKFATWPLAENLLNVVGEMPSDDPQGRLRYIEGDFKDSVSGGKVHIERKGKDPSAAPCTARHVFATNTLPVFFDKSEGIWDRLIIIPFTRRFRGTAGEVRDIAAEICRAEMPGILNFAIEGLARLRRLIRFPEPEACILAKERHRERCDLLQVYCHDYYYSFEREGEPADSDEEGATPVSPDHATPVEEAYKHYVDWARRQGVTIRSCPAFCDAMKRAHGTEATPRSRRNPARDFHGVKALFPYPGYRPEDEAGNDAPF